MKRFALIIIGHFKPNWQALPEEEQVDFIARVVRMAKAVGVKPVVGYTLTTQGSFLQIWEADNQTALEEFKLRLEALGYKKYYDQALMLGERQEDWIDTRNHH